MTNSNDQGSPWKAFFLVGAISVDFAFCVMLGFFLGKWLASMWGAGILWYMSGIILGIAAGAFSAYYLIKRFLTEEQNE